jgi:PAS domain S-box-containing protein
MSEDAVFDPALAREMRDQLTLLKDRMLLHEQITRYAPDAILVVRSDGGIIYANDRAATMFGYWQGELLGLPIEALVPLGARPEHAAHRATFQRAPRYRQMGVPGMLISAQRQNGEVFRCEVQLVPLTIEMGSVVAAYVRDLGTLEPDVVADAG